MRADCNESRIKRQTLLEALVSEGLADHFAIELLEVPVPPWSDALPWTETAHYLELAQPEFDSVEYGHPRGFFGSSPDLPCWTGYTLGFRLVESYQAARVGVSSGLRRVGGGRAAIRFGTLPQ